MTLNGCAALRGRDFNLKVALSRKQCEIGPRLQLITNRKSYTGFDWHRKQWPWMTLSTKIEVFYGFHICSQWAFIHALLSRVPFALAELSCFHSVTTIYETCVCVCLLGCSVQTTFTDCVCQYDYSRSASWPRHSLTHSLTQAVACVASLRSS